MSVAVGTAPSPEDTCVRGTSFTDETPTLSLNGAPEQLTAGSAPPLSLAAGAVLCGRYVLEEEIGRGGTSLVFRARDLQQTLSADGAVNPIAIKVLRPELRGNRWAMACLQREFRQMQRLSHPAIARVLELGCDGDVWFISMELVVGQTVRTWNGTPCDPAIAMRIIEGCCAAIEHAHALGILHGDLKPTNVIVTRHGTALLIDFGSMPEPGSRIPAGELRALAATPLYASPQILMGREGEARDDVFSLACLSYAILSGGGHPFGGHPSFEDGRVKSAPTYARSIAAELFKVIERGLSGERERRQGSVREFRLEMLAAGRRAQADTTTVAGSELIPRGAPSAADRRLAGDLVAALPGWADRIKVDTRASWRTPIRAPLIALGVAVIAIALVFRHGTPGVARNANALPMQAPSPVAKPVPEVIPEAGTQPPPVAATSPPVHDMHGNGVVSFASETIHATAAQSLVAIAVRRLGRTAGRGAFRWRVAQGSADVDFNHVGAQTGLVRFNEGQSVRTLFIPLNNAPTTPARGRREFTVTLERVAGGPSLGSPASVTVAIDPPAGNDHPDLNYLRASN